MDILKNERQNNYDYTCRYTGVSYFYNSEDKKDIYGIGKNMVKNFPSYSHKVSQSDTLYSLSLKYYASPIYWWVIAYGNDINDAFIKLSDYFDIIQIPNISSITFGELR